MAAISALKKRVAELEQENAVLRAEVERLTPKPAKVTAQGRK